MSAADGYGYQLVTVPTGNQHETDKTYQQICQGTGAIARTFSFLPRRLSYAYYTLHTFASRGGVLPTWNNMVSPVGGSAAGPLFERMHHALGVPFRVGGRLVAQDERWFSVWRLRIHLSGIARSRSTHVAAQHVRGTVRMHPTYIVASYVHGAPQHRAAPRFPCVCSRHPKTSVLVFRVSFAQCRLASGGVPATSQYMLTLSHLHPPTPPHPTHTRTHTHTHTHAVLMQR